MIQSARVAFDQMSNDIRLAGFEFDADGEITPYPNQPDEPIEYMHSRAIVVRANYDFAKELRGREPGLELPGSAVDDCCPVVTTSNEEFVAFALGKPAGETQPTGSIVFKADVSGTNDLGPTFDDDFRDAKVDRTTGAITGEETVTIPNVELTNFSNPPYVLYRFQLND